MKFNRSFLWLSLLIIALLLLKFLFFPGGEKEQAGLSASSGRGAPPPPSVVQGYVVKASPLERKLQVTGTILANEEVDLRPEISGKVSSIALKEGQTAVEGQLLIKLVDKDLQAQLRKVIAQQKLAESRRSRLQQLLKIQGVSQQEYDEAENEADAYAADAEVLRVQIDRTEIRAPFKGAIGLRSVSVGSFVSPTDILASIRQLDPIKIEFSVPGRYAGVINAGKEIQFSVEGDTAARIGIVYAVEPGIEASSRTLKVRARADNPNHTIRPGAFVRVNLILDRRENALMVPTQAIVPVLKGQQVYVDSSGIATARPVILGVREERQVEVTHGLSEGETIIVTGVMGLRPGAPVKISNTGKQQ